MLSAIAAAALTYANLPAYGALLNQWRFDPTENQLELKVDEGTQPRYFLLAKPLRIVVDLPGTTLGTVEQVQTYSGSVRQIRVSQFQPDTTRIVMELSPDVVLEPGQVQLQAQGSGQTSWVLKPLIAGEAASTVPVAIAPPPSEPPQPTAERPAVPAPEAPPQPADSGDANDAADLLAAQADPGIDIPIEAPTPPAASPTTSAPPTAAAAIAPNRPSRTAPPPAPEARPSGLADSVELPPAAPFRPSSQQSIQVKVPDLGAATPARPAPSTDTRATRPVSRPPAAPALKPERATPAVAPEAPVAATPDPPSVSRQQPSSEAVAEAQGAIAPQSAAEESPIEIAVELPPATVSATSRPAVQVPDLGRSPAAAASPQAPPAEVSVEVPIEVPVEVPVEVSTDLPPTLETPATPTATVRVPALEEVRVAAPERSPAAPIEVPVELPPAQATEAELPRIQVPALAATPPEAALGEVSEVSQPSRSAIAPREFSFGQPLPEVIVAGSGAPSTPSVDVPDLPAGTESPDTVAIAVPALNATASVPRDPAILLSKGTQFKLRYPGDAPLKLEGDQARQEVLLLQEAVLDEAGNVVLAEGTQVIGRFETSRRGSRFFVQAVTLADRNVLVTGKSDYVSKKGDDDELLLGSGIGAIAGTVIGGFTGVGLIGGAVAGAASTFFGSSPSIVIQPGQTLQVELAEDLYRS